MSDVTLSFDFEMFMGKTVGSIDQCLLVPGMKIYEVLKKNKASSVFFVDTPFLTQLKAQSYQEYCKVETFLKQLSDSGTEVALHIHPQWIDSVLDSNGWRFESLDHYRLHSLEQEKIEELFSQGTQLIDSMTGIAPTSFRAGGWCIQPFNEIKSSMENNGICIDSSVLPGQYRDERPHHYYDFKQIENPQKNWWNFSEDPCVEDQRGSFLEIPVSQVDVRGTYILTDFLLRKYSKSPVFGDGSGLRQGGDALDKIKRIFHTNKKRLTIEAITDYLLQVLLHKSKDSSYLNFVMHPKSLSETSISQLDMITSRYDTITYRDIASKEQR